ncbi:serine hydrolase FSH [Corynascus similis CBS 632.67]
MTAKSKPSIVFLHGSGTNPDIFRMQARKLSAHLEPHFTLHYLAAPIPCGPGPGVLPFFQGCEPYLTWMDDSSAEAEAAYWNGNSNSLLGKLVEEIKGLGGGDGGDVVGLVGFSMGGKVATEVVRRLEAAGDRRVKVVVPVCATVPLQGGLVKEGDKDEAKEKGYREILARGVVRAESVHLIGERDPWRPQSEMLVDFYDEKGRSVIRFKGEHHMPLNDAINSNVSKIILTACKIA